MIVSNTLTTALDCVPLDAGAGAPTVGISPAKAETERTDVKAIVIRNLFIDVAPSMSKRCKTFYIAMNRTTTQGTLQAASPQTNIPFAIDRILTCWNSQLLMQTTSPKLNLSHLPANERALFRCSRALELKDRGEYDAAQEIMRPLWKRIGERPNIHGLHPSVAAEVLFCVGVLTGWIGSRNEIKEADEAARDLLTESITAYESLGDLKKVAEVRSELALCYWRAGALDEARVMFTESLEKLTAPGNTRANALLGLSVVEWSASRFKEALRILTDNAPLFEKIPNHTTKGTYHNQVAMILRSLASEGEKADYFQRAIKEYERADQEFKLAHNLVFRAHVKNNVGFLLYKVFRFREAHEHLEQARRLTCIVKDKVRTAQIDETRAQVFIAERRFAEAESAARKAARTFEKSGRQCLLAEALITHGIALARLKKTERAQFTFQKAIEVARQVGALNRAGLAALTMIEELDQLQPEILSVAYEQAGEWLSTSQSRDIKLRFEAAGRKLALAGIQKSEATAEILFHKQYRLPDEVLKFERSLISQTLAKVNGSVTAAAKLLGVSYQRLGYILETRHKDLFNERTPVRRRGRKDQ
jgi:tetratricopeptide (TPR) repeat protein